MKLKTADPYKSRNHELKTEESKRAQRKISTGNENKKLERNTEVLDVSEFLRKKCLKMPRNKKGKSIRRNKSLPR